MKMINNLINLLKTDGINSKQKAIDILSNLSDETLIRLRREITEEINHRRLTNG